MSILKRLRTIITGNINDLLDRVDDPEVAINQMIRDLESGIAELRKNTGLALATQKGHEKRLSKYREEAQHWMDHAELALKEGREEEARTALSKRFHMIEKSDLLEPQIKDDQALVQRLKRELHRLEERIQEVRTKRDTLVAKKRMVERRKKITSDTVKTQNGSGIINGFHDVLQRFEEENMDTTAMLEAREELQAEFDQKSVEAEFEQRKREHDIDDELNKLKQKLKG